MIRKKILTSAVVCATLCVGSAATAFAIQPNNSHVEQSVPTELQQTMEALPSTSPSVNRAKNNEHIPVESQKYDSENKCTVITYEDGTKAYLVDSSIEDSSRGKSVEPIVPNVADNAITAEKYGNSECNIDGHFTHIYSNGISCVISNNVKDDNEFKLLGSESPFKDESTYWVLEFLDGTKRYFREYPKEIFGINEEDYGIYSYIESGTGEFYREAVDGGVIEGWR